MEHAPAPLGVQRLDDDLAPADGVVKRLRLVRVHHGLIGQLGDVQLPHFLPHQVLVGEQTAGLVPDAGQAHLLGHVGHRPHRNIRLVGDDAADVVLSGEAENLVSIPHIGEELMGQVWLKGGADDGGRQGHLIPLRRPLDQGELKIPRADEQDGLFLRHRVSRSFPSSSTFRVSRTTNWGELFRLI